MRFFFTFCLIFRVMFTLGQFMADTTLKPNKLELSVDLKSSQLWKGNITTDMPVIISKMSYSLDNTNSLKIGVWGGTALSNNVNGTHYQEIDYFVQFSKRGFSIELWDFFSDSPQTHLIFLVY